MVTSTRQRVRGSEGTSAGRVSRAIEVVTEAPKGVTAAEAAPQIGLTRTAALRLLESMVDAGILVKDPDSRRYDLSLKVFQWGSRAALRYQPAAAVRQEMASLANAAGHQIIYSVLDEDSVVIVEATEMVKGLATTRPAWNRTHWYASTTGTLLLAFADPERQAELLTALPADDPEFVWAGSDLPGLLQQMRQERFAERPLRPGQHMLATPLLDYAGQALAALGMIVYSSDAAEIARLAETLRATGAVCSSLLGYSTLQHH